MTLERFEHFPGYSPGHIGLPRDLRQQIVQHVPVHGELVQWEAEQFGLYVTPRSADPQAFPEHT